MCVCVCVLRGPVHPPIQDQPTANTTDATPPKNEELKQDHMHHATGMQANYLDPALCAATTFLGVFALTHGFSLGFLLLCPLIWLQASRVPFLFSDYRIFGLILACGPSLLSDFRTWIGARAFVAVLGRGFAAHVFGIGWLYVRFPSSSWHSGRGQCRFL